MHTDARIYGSQLPQEPFWPLQAFAKYIVIHPYLLK